MKKTLLIASVITILLASCAEEKDPFLITNGNLGHLTKEIQMKQVDSIFALDSIVPLSSIENALGTQGEVEVYEKNGTKLLLLSPDNETDPTSTITNIQIFDKRYHSEKGLTVNSTFGELKANYGIATIETTINAVVVFLIDSDIYVTIDKKELPENVRYNLNAKIEATQIPDAAKFKYFMIGWDAPEKEKEEKAE
ncbi:MAG: hypothetical protein K0U54_02600 [Bacteroidetes bacterium]|nr:hypothetical protein [Bacteroidota bacterium]